MEKKEALVRLVASVEASNVTTEYTRRLKITEVVARAAKLYELIEKELEVP